MYRKPIENNADNRLSIRKLKNMEDTLNVLQKTVPNHNKNLSK